MKNRLAVPRLAHQRRGDKLIGTNHTLPTRPRATSAGCGSENSSRPAPTRGNDR
jgi:hypothetical protein